jgi:hypothetical protein
MCLKKLYFTINVNYVMKTKSLLHKHSNAAGGLNKSQSGLLHESQYVGIRYLISMNLWPLMNNFPSLCF